MGSATLLLLGLVGLLLATQANATARSCTDHCTMGVNDAVTLNAVANQADFCQIMGGDFDAGESNNIVKSKVGTAEGCMQACLANALCQAWTYLDNTFTPEQYRTECILKYKALAFKYTAGTISGYRNCRKSPCVQYGVRYPAAAAGIELLSAKTNIESIEQCMLECSSFDECKFVSYSILLKTCDLLRAPYGSGAALAAIEGAGKIEFGYVSATRSCNQYECFQQHTNYEEVAVNKKVTALTAKECQEQCNDDANGVVCKTFLFDFTIGEDNCWLQETIGKSILQLRATNAVAGPKCCCPVPPAPP